MPDFTKGVIYTIRTGDSVYVGSTTNFTRRKCEHKSRLYNENGKVYQKIRENDYEWSMKPYKEFPCETKLQLEIEEEQIRRKLNADLNSQSCGTGLSLPEYKKQYKKQYHIDNKDKLNKKSKQYRTDNKDKMNEYKDKYYNQNKEKISEKNKQKVKCECGCISTRCNLSRHKKTKKHLKLMEIINSVK
jgi:hypothetical protein